MEKSKSIYLIKNRTQEISDESTSDSALSNAAIDYFFILFIFFFYIINFYVLISADTTPPKWDEAVHLRDSFVFYNIMSDPSQVNFTVIKEIMNKSDQYPLLRPSGYYPPLVPVITALLYFITGVSIQTALFTNLIFLLILIFSVYYTGAILWDRKTGLSASILVLFFPIILHHSIIYYMDLPLTAITALSIFTLLKTEFFSNTRMSGAFGLFFALGMLTKWTFLFFICGPLVYTIITAFKISAEPNRAISFKRLLTNITLFCVIAVILSGAYYFPILSELIQETYKYTGGPLSHGPASILSLDSFQFYFVALWNEMITPAGLVLFVAGIVIFAFSGSRHRLLIFLSLIIPWFTFTLLIRSKTPRYVMPLLPVISLVVAYGISQISGFLFSRTRYMNTSKYAALFVIMVFGVLYYNNYLSLKKSIISESKQNWNIAGIINAIEDDIDLRPLPKKVVYMGTIPDHEYINAQTIRYFANVKRLSLNVIKLQDYTADAVKKFIEQFDRYDYILTKNLSNIVKPEFQKSIDDMNKFFYTHAEGFVLLKTFTEPDGSEVEIYRRK